MPVLARKDVPKENTWNREAVYPSWDDWQAEFDIAVSDIQKLHSYEGQLGESPDRLLAWFTAYGRHYQRVHRLREYVRMHVVTDLSDDEAKGRFGQVSGLFADFSRAVAFVEPEILSLGERVYQLIEKEPRLAPFKQYFDNIFRLSPHTRSEEVEEILGMVADPFGSLTRTISELTDRDLKFADAVDQEGAKHPVLQTTIAPTGIQSGDPARRKSAWENFADGYLSMENTLAAGYITNVKQWLFLARTRGHESVLEHTLAPTNTPVAIFHNLVDTFSKNLSVWHKYWDVKRKILRQDQIHPFDVWAPVVQEPPTIPFEQAVSWICEALAPLGDEYVAILRKGCIEDRWVDWAPNAGKRQGAASSIMVGGKPPFIFTSYDESMLSASIVAHELGHSMHSYYTYHNVPDVYNGLEAISQTVMETASNFHQAMLRAYLRSEKSDDTNLQIAMVDEAIFNFHRYFLTMPTLARFEYEVFSRAEEGKPLTIGVLKDLMKRFYAEAYGETMTDDPGRSAIAWAQFLHLYFQPFYTFQYSVGISAAAALSEGVLAGKDGAAERYLSFLKAGGSRYTMDLFGLAGVDMTSPEPIEAAFRVLAGLVDELERLAT